ncbi:MAG: aspartyl protease family protein [Thermoanaerobaculia bacterium]|nr:aspartyl protease family protein [Thermoanaerobaculia bacterium]
MKNRIGCLLGLLVFCAAAAAQDQPPEWIIEGPYLGEGSTSTEVPLRTMATKLHVEVEIGGQTRRFVVDTGSPSMIDTALAKELGLEVVGKSQGRDSHGVVIESDIVQATLKLGGVTFHKVPMFSADFSTSETTKFFLGDGLFGSELLPLGAWQIDLQNSVLRFDTDAQKLPSVGNATKVPLHGFGYPHAPILDVQFAKRARSKAMFDTGSPGYFAISKADFAGAEQGGGIGTSRAGFGSAGGSLGGQAPDSDQLQAELKTLSIDNLKLGRVGAIRRDSSPSLIGAAMLEHFIVTFDARSGAAYFAKYSDGPFVRPSFGFTLAFDGKISVALVWDDSPAHKAGLEPGIHLTSINGTATELSSEGIQRAVEAMSGQDIELEWEGGSVHLVRDFHLLQE